MDLPVRGPMFVLTAGRMWGTVWDQTCTGTGMGQPRYGPESRFFCPYLLSSETTAKGTGLEKLAGKEDPVELDSSLAL